MGGTHRYIARTHDYIPGPVNASRLWHLTDTELLTHFNSRYPQLTPWRLRTLTPTMASALTGVLFKKQCDPVSLSSVVLPQIPLSVSSGRPFVPSSASHPASPIVPRTASLFCNSLPTDTAQTLLSPAIAPCDLARWKTPYEVWGRRLPGWRPRILI